jgi:hypothetical protein
MLVVPGAALRAVSTCYSGGSSAVVVYWGILTKGSQRSPASAKRPVVATVPE